MRYFVPEWDDKVDPTFDFSSERHLNDGGRTNLVYMWQIFPPGSVPFDGLLVSLMTIKDNLRKESAIKEAGGLREYLGLPSTKSILADCGAWGYIKSEQPRFGPIEVLDYYQKLGVEEAVTVDHLAIPSYIQNGKVVKVDVLERLQVTYSYGLRGFHEWRKRYQNDFQLLVSVQGVDVPGYIDMYRKYISKGVESLAFGGLARRPTHFILKFLDALRHEIVRGGKPPEKLHFFGLGRQELFPSFQILEELGTKVSFDTASWLRRAWLSGEYYLIDGETAEKYTAVRVPITQGSNNSFKGKRRLSPDADSDLLRELEGQCLRSIRDYARGEATLEQPVSFLKKYNSELLKQHLISVRMNGDAREVKSASLRRFYRELDREYERTLRDRPWSKCPCEVCTHWGSEVVVFRGNDRNRRRGFHNTHAFYFGLLRNSKNWSLKFGYAVGMNRLTPADLAALAGNVLVITGCTKTKQGYNEKVAAKASDMYKGRLFKAVKSYSELKRFPYVIISAKYGLIRPEDMIGGYNQTIKDADDIERLKPMVQSALLPLRANFDRIIVIAGSQYRRVLEDIWDSKFAYLAGGGYADLCEKVNEAIAASSSRRIDSFASGRGEVVEVPNV